MKRIFSLSLAILIIAISLLTLTACSKKDNEFVAIEAQDLLKEDFGIAVKKGDAEMKQAVDEVINEWLEDGTMDKYLDYYKALHANPNEPPESNGLKTSWSFGDNGTITVYTESGFAPFEFLYGKDIVGVDIAIMSEVAERQGKKIEIKDGDFKAIPLNVQNHQGEAVGAAGLTIDDKRALIVDFSRVYYSSTIVIVSSKDDAYSKISKLGGLTVGVQDGTSGDLILRDVISSKGYTYVDSNNKEMKIQVDVDEIRGYKQYSLAFMDLKNGRIDAIVMDKLPAEAMLSLEEVGFFESFKNILTVDNLLNYLEGFRNTIIISTMATIVGVIIGALLATLNYVNKKTGKLKIISKIANVYITIVRGTPVVLQLMILYYVVFTGFNPIIVGALTFGFNSSAYVAEILRAGFESIDDGQREAGRSLGLSTWQTMFHIIIPQAIKRSLPSLFNEFITLVKETAIVGYVAIKDLSKVTDQIGGTTFNYIAPLIISAGIYLGIVMLLTLALRKIEKALAKSDRNGGAK